ncbi:hypothetical protein ACF065_08225 [Streptomyces sp. NPDC015232]|uniref:hypothetical protein n=1 Tax=unclassified Streptomyces TaxID=2593676 RepID=UPI0036FDFDE3
MSPVLAFARSRGVPAAAATALVLAVVTTLAARSRVELPDFRHLVDFGVPVAAVAPVGYAVVLGTTLHTPQADLEHLSARPLGLFRRLHLLALTLLAVALAALPLLTGTPGAVVAASARNAAGHLGLAALSARLFGPGLAWLLPLGTFGPTLLLGVAEDNTPEWWAWSIQGPYETGALVIAGLLWGAGVLVAGADPGAGGGRSGARGG